MEGNGDNLIELVDRYGTELYRFCYSLTRHKEDADDLFQNTFVKLVEQRVAIDPQRNPKALLFSITVRIWQSERRKNARRMRLAPPVELRESAVGEYGNPDQDLMAREEYAQVQNLVEEMEEHYRLPLTMYYTVEMSVSEIATVLGIPQGTVKSRLHKARQILSERWEAAELCDMTM